MKKIPFSCAMMATLFLTAFSVFSQEQAEAPVYRDGDFWHFRATQKLYTIQTSDVLDGEYEISIIGGKPQVFQLTAGQKVEAGGRAIDELTRMIADVLGRDEMQHLQFPLAVGKKWETNYQATPEGTRRLERRTAETRVVAFEAVRVPAGTLRAFKIERGDIGGRSTRWAYTYLYSPESKSIVKYSRDVIGIQSGATAASIEVELIKFGSTR